MQIFSLSELGPEHEIGVAALQEAAFGYLGGTQDLRRKISLGIPYSSYAALYAVEGSEVLSMVEVPRMIFLTRHGPVLMGGFACVCTRPDQARRGVATSVLTEVLRREREDGIRYMLLWTGRAMVAHSLYERLGFTDVFATPAAYRRITSKSEPPAGYSVGNPNEDELVTLESLRDEMARGRLGFSPRFKGLIRALVKSGAHSLSNILTISKGGGIVGYAILRPTDPASQRSWEMVAPALEDRIPLVKAVESKMTEGWFMFTTCPGDVWSSVAVQCGYEIRPSRWGTLMACQLDGKLGDRELRHELGTDDPSFIAQEADNF